MEVRPPPDDRRQPAAEHLSTIAPRPRCGPSCPAVVSEGCDHTDGVSCLCGPSFSWQICACLR
eukprot:1642581-Pyramimonas_sp.AAC.1